MGRSWLFEEVRPWAMADGAAAEPPRAQLIEAEYGVGKSAFLAELVDTRAAGVPVVAQHFCQFDAIATLAPGRFVISIAAQLAAALPAYRDVIEAEKAAGLHLQQHLLAAVGTASFLDLQGSAEGRRAEDQRVVVEVGHQVQLCHAGLEGAVQGDGVARGHHPINGHRQQAVGRHQQHQPLHRLRRSQMHRRPGAKVAAHHADSEELGLPAKALVDRDYVDRQDSFIQRVKDAGLTLQFFRNPDDLKGLVERSLRELAESAAATA